MTSTEYLCWLAKIGLSRLTVLAVTDILTTCADVIIRVKVKRVQWIDGITLEPENFMTPCYCVRYRKSLV